MGLHYYSRWAFIYELLPLLRKAKDAGEDAKAMSILGAGNGVAVDVDNLGLKKNYLAGNPAFTGCTYTDLAMQSFAEQHPDIAFIHTDPGVVRDTQLLVRLHWSMRVFGPLVMGLFRPWSVFPEECAEYTLYTLFQSEKGICRRGSRGDDIGKSRLHDADDIRRRVWDHTKEEIERALQMPAADP